MAEAAVDARSTADDDEFTGTHHIFEPYRAGLPAHLGSYFSELWRRREFMREMASSTVRAEQQDTWFGRTWNIINPLLMGGVYFLLVNILTNRGTHQFYFAYLLAGLFLFDALGTAMAAGSKSVTGAGRMVTNTAFPRVLLPLASVRTAVAELVPAIIVLVVVGLITGVRPHWAWLACIPMVLIFIVFATGMAMLLATLQVYFRDTKSFLPYFTRLWLYASPVLWMVSQTPSSFQWMRFINPMYDIVGGWSEAFVFGQWPSVSTWLLSIAWAIISLLVGGYVFLSRERDFAVRI